MRLRAEDVYSIHVALCFAALLEALDVCNIRVEDVVLLDNVVYELLGVFINNENLPL